MMAEAGAIKMSVHGNQTRRGFHGHIKTGEECMAPLL